MTGKVLGSVVALAVGMVTILGALVSIGVQIGSMQTQLADADREIGRLRDDIRIVNALLMDRLPGPPAPGR
jgi:hypothetical protein